MRVRCWGGVGKAIIIGILILARGNQWFEQTVVAFTVVLRPIALTQSCFISVDQGGVDIFPGVQNPTYPGLQVSLLEASETS